MFWPIRFLGMFLVTSALLVITFTLSLAEDLRVGTWKTPQTIQPFFYKRFVPQNQKVTVYSFTNPADQKTALLAGSLDMCGTTLAVDQGYGEILSYPYYEESVGTINAGMLVERKTIEKHPERVQTLVNAHVHATEFLQTHPDEWLKRASSFGAELRVLEKAAPNMELAWRMDADFVKRARALGTRMEELGVIRNQPDYDRLFDLSFVNKDVK